MSRLYDFVYVELKEELCRHQFDSPRMVSKVHLQDALNSPLPGEAAQYRMAPALRKTRIAQDLLAQAKQSAVLIAVFPGGRGPEDLHIAYMKRAEYPGVHSGQISFPGGAYETEDQEISTTALREAEEEVGIISTAVDVLGRLSELYVPPSGFMIHPFVGWLDNTPNFVIDETEVAHVFTVSLTQLLDPAVKSSFELEIANGMMIDAPVYNFETDNGVERVWGATAMITSELETVIRALV